MYVKKNLDYKPHYSKQIATRTLCKYSMWERMEVRTFGVCLLKSRETTCGIRCSEGELSVLSFNSQGPHSHILMTGGPTEVHILYPKKSQLQNLSTQKNPYFFLSIPKNLWPKCQTQKNPSAPPVIKICEWGPWDSIIPWNLLGRTFTW